jgi:branched-chain amino acid transport system substrate-binding protein
MEFLFRNARNSASSFLFSALVLAGCGGAVTEPTPPTPAPPPVESILIGHYASLTGASATYGGSTRNGVALAVEERNTAGGIKGRPVEVRFYDDLSDPAEAMRVVTRLANDDKVVAMIGGDSSTVSIAGGQTAQQLGVPMVTPSSTNADVTAVGDMVFRVCFVDAFQGYVAARFTRDQLKIGKVATLFDGGQAYSRGLGEEFAAQFSRLGGAVVATQEYHAGDQDFAAQLGAIKEAAPEALFVPGYYADVGKIAVQARHLGLSVPLLGGDGWDSAQLAAIAGDAVEGAYFISHYTTTDPRPKVQDFVKLYQAHYSSMPDAPAALGYDAARVVMDAMERAPTLERRAVADALAQVRGFDGVTGRITMDAARNAQKPAVIVQMKGGQPTYVIDIESPEAASLDAGGAPAPAEPAAPAAPAPAAVP